MLTFTRIFRLWPAWILSVAMLMIVYAVAPQQLPLLAYKAAFVTFGAINGYWLHVWTLGHIDDNETAFKEDVNQHERWRRAVYMVAIALAFAMAA